MVKYFLKFDYVLSVWFPKTKDKIVPGTAFLFLNKVVFLWAIILFLLSPILNLKEEIEVFVGIQIVGAALIMFGFQKPVELIIHKGNFKQEYKQLTKRKINQGKLLALGYLIIFFVLVFIAGILSFRIG